MAERDEVVGGKYRLIEPIGKGGMGAIWEAVHEEIGKHVAVKLLHPEIARDPESVTRFKREARAAAAIGHRNIIDIYDIGTAPDGALFLVMEKLVGMDLADLIDEKGYLDTTFSVYVVCQVLSALHAAHEAGIVHRDLKPENIFLLETGEKLPGIKLLDFGISRMVDPTDPEERLTKTGIVLGTPYYMSPEQVRGLSDLDHRMDIYSTGMILFECLTGQVIFNAENTLALLQCILNEPLTPPRTLRPELPAELEQVVLKALSRQRADRYGAAHEMLEALFPFLDEHSAGRVSLPQRRETGATPLPRPLTLDERLEQSTADTLALDATRPSLSAADTPSKPERNRTPLIIVLVFLCLIVGGLTGVFFLDSGPDEIAAPQAPPVPTPGEPAVPPAPVDAGRARDARAPEPAPAQHVTLTLENVPDGGAVFFGDTPVELTGTKLRLERSPVARELRVELAGHEPWRKLVALDRDRTLTVSLAPSTTAKRPRRQGQSAGTADAPRPPERREQRPTGAGEFETEFRP